MMKRRTRHIICILCLLLADIGCISAGTPRKVRTDKHGVKESATVDLLPKKKVRDSGKITFRCRISKYSDRCMMLAKVLKNDSTMHIVRPGVKFMLTNGDSVVLKAERPRVCCSEWADGRWYNAAFRLEEADIEKMKGSDIVSVFIHIPDSVVSRDIAPGKEDAVEKLLRSVERE
ncbi:hypothetical protein AB9N12_10890 [Bacteroides sp. AN502(2024)]|uniref:hypothetical protein n=1 Tax=Bacteroides sp. AN502(2024) TaxID=3160599 RepID=UPI0035168091